MKRKWIGILLVVIIGGGLVWRLRTRAAKTPPPKEIMQVTVTRGSIEATIEASGRVLPRAEATLAFDTPGTVAQVLVQEGAWVAAGDPLIRLETADMERAVRSAEQTLAIQKANLAELRRGARDAEVAAARAAVASAQAQLDQLLAGPRAEEIAAAQANLQVAQANLWAASAQRDQVLAGATAAEIAAAQAQLASAQAQHKIALDTHNKLLQCETVTLPNGKTEEICPGLGTPEEQARYNLHAAEAALEAAQAQLDQLLAGATDEQIAAAQASVAAAAAQRDAAQAQLDLLLAGSTEAQVAAARAQLAQAQATLTTLIEGPTEEQLARATAQVEQARIALEEARDRLADATLRAPFSGLVSQVRVETGERVMAGAPVLTLTDLSAVEVELTVDQVDIGQVTAGQTARVTLETWPDATIPATVTRIAPQADLSTGVVNYRVYLALDFEGTDFAIAYSDAAPDARLIRPYMTANAEIVTARVTNALLVPNRAIQADRSTGQYRVERWDAATGQAEQVPVTLGVRNATYAQVSDGLQEGDVVLVRLVRERPDQALTLPGMRQLFEGR